MKRILAGLLVLVMLLSAAPAYAADAAQQDEAAIAKLSEMVRTYDTGDYFGSLSVTIGEKTILKDGKEIPIDDAGTTAYIENGKTMLPIRVIAEEIGAKVEWNNKTRSIKLSDDENTVQMAIGSNEMNVNGQIVELQAAPEITNSRTMLPARDVAEALNCDVGWDAESRTATITRPLQTKRIVALSDQADTTGALSVARLYGMVVMQFDTVAAAQACLDRNKKLGIKAEPDYVQTMTAMSWGAEAIGGNVFYDETKLSNNGAVVAVIDSGIDDSHPFFSGRIVTGYDMLNNDNHCEDLDGHGTHVASTVLDIAGSNPKIKVMSVKVFGGKGSSTTSAMVAAAIRYAANRNVNVISLSLGGPYYCGASEEAVSYARSRNIAVVAAAGNEHVRLSRYSYSPATIPGVITVSACDEKGNLAKYSNYGEGIIDFAAPGTGITGARVGGGTVVLSGTSMATPHVSGVYALYMAAHPEKTVDQITEALRQNTVQKGTTATFGAGVIRARHGDKYLSSLTDSKIEVTDITQDSARIRGSFKYSGVFPSVINIKLAKGNGSPTPVSGLPYHLSGNTISYDCVLKDKGVTLSPNTTYTIGVGAVQGGTDYLGATKTFTTAPEPEADSTLRIDITSYPTSLKQGSPYGLRGTVSSNYPITQVNGYVFDSAGNTKLSSVDYPNATSMDVRYAHLNNDLIFNNLAPGSYTMRVIATDGKAHVQWTKQFTVGGEASDTAIRIDLTSYPTVHTAGKAHGLRGSVESGLPITKVEGFVYDSAGNLKLHSVDYPNATSMNIRYANLNNDLIFNNLDVGTYTMKVVATNGTSTADWARTFTVVGS